MLTLARKKEISIHSSICTKSIIKKIGSKSAAGTAPEKDDDVSLRFID